jgi:hypothetical protein
MLSVANKIFMKIIIMMNVVMLSVVMLNVVAPFQFQLLFVAKYNLF